MEVLGCDHLVVFITTIVDGPARIIVLTIRLRQLETFKTSDVKTEKLREEMQVYWFVGISSCNQM